MNNRKSKFLRQLAEVNIPKGGVWEEYEERVVKQRVVPKRKLVEELNEKEKNTYSAQIISAEEMVKGTDEKAYIVVPEVFPSIMRTLKKNCGKFIYKQLKKAAKSGKLGNLTFSKRNS